MKLREPIQRYSVGKHGSEYLIYPSLAMLCPECQSMNIREVNSSGDYLCTDCGCEFDTWIGSELTSFGKFMDKFTKVMVVISVVLAGVCLIAGSVYLFHLEKVYGYGNIPDNLDLIGLAVAIGGLSLFLIVAGIFYAVNERI